jgi:glycolate oxidase FAD binding subunit
MNRTRWKKQGWQNSFKMGLQPEAIWAELSRAVKSGSAFRAGPADAIEGVLPCMVIEPSSAAELASLLSLAAAAGICVAPRGGGTKMGWGNIPRKVDVVISTRRLARVLEHSWADMTVTVEAGCTVAELERVLAERNQRLAIEVLWPEAATIGGILATNDSGPLRVRFGSLRDLVIGITVALPDGSLAKSGGKVVKNVAGYDLPKLFVGSLGTLGIITQATFRLHSLPHRSRTLSFTMPGIEEANRFILAILDSRLAPTGIQLRAQANSLPCVDLRFEGSQAGIDAQTDLLLKIATAGEKIESPPQVWKAIQNLWQGLSPSLICKFSLLPTDLTKFCQSITNISVNWKLVMQAIGVGLLRLEASEKMLLAAHSALKAYLKPIGGTLVVLSAPLEVKSRIDVWGEVGDALPLMRRIKQRFDPKGILNPGRFVAGI